MSKELESALQRRCQAIVKDGKGFVIKTHASAYTRVGIPDLICCIPVSEEKIKHMLENNWFKNNEIGLFVGLEMKREGELNRNDARQKAQKIVGSEIKDAGGLWFMLDSSEGVEALMAFLRGVL